MIRFTHPDRLGLLSDEPNAAGRIFLESQASPFEKGADVTFPFANVGASGNFIGKEEKGGCDLLGRVGADSRIPRVPGGEKGWEGPSLGLGAPAWGPLTLGASAGAAEPRHPTTFFRGVRGIGGWRDLPPGGLSVTACTGRVSVLVTDEQRYSGFERG